jgi:hypothetical protein
VLEVLLLFAREKRSGTPVVLARAISNQGYLEGHLRTIRQRMAEIVGFLRPFVEEPEVAVPVVALGDQVETVRYTNFA